VEEEAIGGADERLGTWVITECINSRAAAAYIEGRLWPILEDTSLCCSGCGTHIDHIKFLLFFLLVLCCNPVQMLQ
jgi:hypothetical protein